MWIWKLLKQLYHFDADSLLCAGNIRDAGHFAAA